MIADAARRRAAPAGLAMSRAGAARTPGRSARWDRGDRRDARNAQRPEIAPGAASPAAAAERRALRLRPVRNWGYWLSSFDIADVVAAPHDLMVVDNGVSADHRFVRERSAEEVARMKRRPDGSARILLSYLSIGEAERYRAYWRPDWYEPDQEARLARRREPGLGRQLFRPATGSRSGRR